MVTAHLERTKVERHDRLDVIERFIKDVAPESTVELGAGDYSFDYTRPGRNGDSWLKLDMAPPCDILCDFNDPHVKLPLPANTFDLAICTEVLEHLLWPDALVSEVHRILKPGGALIVSVPNAVSLTYRVAWAIGHIPSCAATGNLKGSGTAYRRDDGTLIGGHVVDFSKKRLEALLENAGYQLVKMRGSGLIRNGQLVPHWAVPTSLASNLIALVAKPV
jgi:SAM-dependent methyltransferase